MVGRTLSGPLRLAFGLGVMAAAIGLWAVIGWHAHSRFMVAIAPSFVPVQYNTGLGLLAMGVGLALASAGLRRPSAVLGGLVCLLGSATLLQDILGVSLGIDQIFMHHTFTEGTRHPGRMAPHTALSFILVGAATMLSFLGISGTGGDEKPQRFVRAGRTAAQIMAGVAAGLGLVAILGYYPYLESAYGWGDLTRMAPLTAVGVVLLGLGIWIRVRAEGTADARGIFPSIGIGWKVTLLVVGTALISSLMVGGWIFRQLTQQLVREEEASMRHALDLASDRLESHLSRLEGDALMIPRFSVVESLAEQMGGGLPDAGLVDAVERTFVSIMRHRTDYFQMRLIAPDEAGREIVRVERDPERGEILVVASEDLQLKGRRPYVMEARSLSEGELYLSPIELNREHGAIATPHVPVIRASTPVRGDMGELLGVVVINLDARLMLSRLERVVPWGYQLYMFSGRGDYILHPEPGAAFAFEFGRSRTIEDDFPGWRDRRSGLPTSFMDLTRTTAGGERLVFSSREHALDADMSGDSIVMALACPYSDVMAATAKTRRQAEGIGALAVLASAGLGAVLGRSLTKPVRRLILAVRKFGENEADTDLPVDASDEAGELARAFGDMTGQVVARRRELEVENRQRRIAELRLAGANRNLLEKNQQLEQFAYIASHDLQEPLRKIQTFGDMLKQEKAERLDEAGVDYLDRMQSAAARMRNLIDGLLAYSRVTSKGVEPENVDLNGTVAGVLSDLEARVADSEGRVEVGPMPTLRADPMQARQLFQNLIGNALKFRRDDEPPVVRVGARRSDEGNQAGWRITVEDNGIGFEQKYADRIFAPFQRLHGRGKYEGTGMGLALCKRIADRHEWELSVESEPGRGTVFTLLCPDQDQEREGAPNTYGEAA